MSRTSDARRIANALGLAPPRPWRQGLSLAGDWPKHSISLRCRAPHLPLELGCVRALLEDAGHAVLPVDAHAHRLSQFRRFGDIRDNRPLLLQQLEAACC